MDVWTWKGKYFGYIEENQLRTHNGLHVGNIFDGTEIYGRDGKYLGEIRNGDSLITRRNKSSRKKSRFTPKGKRVGRVKSVNRIGKAMIAGYEDFPGPETFN